MVRSTVQNILRSKYITCLLTRNLYSHALGQNMSREPSLPSSSSFIHNIYKQIHIHINDKFAQYNTLIVKLDNMKYVQVCICCKVLHGQ